MIENEEDYELPVVPEEDDEDLIDKHEFIVDKGQEPYRIDKFMTDRIERISRTKLQAAANAGTLTVNDKIVKSNYKIRPGDKISLIITKPVGYVKMEPENIPLKILYEDEDVVVIDKQAGLVVHPGVGNFSGTLVNALMYHFKSLPNNGDETRPGLVHRLDKNTSGVMVIAKNEFAMSHLAKQFFERTIDRNYVALVWGDFDEEKGVVDVNIGRSHRQRQQQEVFPNGDEGKHAVTHYEVLERFGYSSLVRCKLETGRTHQIRVHMKYIGHTVFSDERYGGDKILTGTIYSKYKQFVDNCFSICRRQALHARSLGFTHPQTGKRLSFETPMPTDMEDVVEKWRKYAKLLEIQK
jgi:23S rRNA pseudouridine1911/1915/1917 synthase